MDLSSQLLEAVPFLVYLQSISRICGPIICCYNNHGFLIPYYRGGGDGRGFLKESQSLSNGTHVASQLGNLFFCLHIYRKYHDVTMKNVIWTYEILVFEFFFFPSTTFCRQYDAPPISLLRLSTINVVHSQKALGKRKSHLSTCLCRCKHSSRVPSFGWGRAESAVPGSNSSGQN